MEEFCECLHRTLVQYLIEGRHPELAAAVLDGGIDFRATYNDFQSWYIDLPPSAYNLIGNSEEMQSVLRRAFRAVASGRTRDGNGNLVEEFDIQLRMKLLDIETGWQEAARRLILQYKGSNQGLLSEMLAKRDGRPVHTWNELRYASASEIRIAQELERLKTLFFPLALGVRAETGENWKDHREADFLICHKGVWGILEVSYHPDRYEKDSEKDVWFKKSGILCVQHYTAERCFNRPAEVVAEFMSILAQYEK